MSLVDVADTALRSLQTIAEFTQRASAALRPLHPEVDCAAIAGFRDVLVLDHLSINLNRVWEIVERNALALKPRMDVNSLCLPAIIPVGILGETTSATQAS